jgi:hypothetical protein
VNTTRPPRTLSPEKIRDARLAALLAAAIDYEAAPHFVHLQELVLASARAWAKAEREINKRTAKDRRIEP